MIEEIEIIPKTITADACQMSLTTCCTFSGNRANNSPILICHPSFVVYRRAIKTLQIRQMRTTSIVPMKGCRDKNRIDTSNTTKRINTYRKTIPKYISILFKICLVFKRNFLCKQKISTGKGVRGAACRYLFEIND
jgi:hypothetical protein